MPLLYAIVTGVISGLCASILFWLGFFKYSMTKICFSNVIIRSKNVSEDDGSYRYRVRVANVGFINLMDIELRATIRIKMINEMVNTAPVTLGSDGRMTMLEKQPAYFELKSSKKTPKVSVSTIYLTENSLKEYKKNFILQKYKRKQPPVS